MNVGGEEIERRVCDLSDSVHSFKQHFFSLWGDPFNIIDISYQGITCLLMRQTSEYIETGCYECLTFCLTYNTLCMKTNRIDWQGYMLFVAESLVSFQWKFHIQLGKHFNGSAKNVIHSRLSGHFMLKMLQQIKNSVSLWKSNHKALIKGII